MSVRQFKLPYDLYEEEETQPAWYQDIWIVACTFFVLGFALAFVLLFALHIFVW